MQSWEREYYAREEGKEEGLREGIKEGGIRSLIEAYREFSVPKEEVLLRIEKKFSVSREEAEQYWEEYAGTE